MLTHIECPSGLAGEVRGLTGREGKLLGDRTLARSGATIDKLLQSCWMTTSDAGVYELADGKPDWSKVLIGDRFFALIQIRRASFGDEYAFGVQCQSAGCRERYEWELKLSELPVRTMSEDARARFRSVNRFETTLPRQGRRVWYRLLTGADEARTAAIRRQGRDNLLLEAVAMRVVEIEGVADKDRRRYLEDTDLGDLTYLLDAFDREDGGVETSIEVECPSCGAAQDIELPFERGFFFPRPRKAPIT